MAATLLLRSRLGMFILLSISRVRIEFPPTEFPGETPAGLSGITNERLSLRHTPTYSCLLSQFAFAPFSRNCRKIYPTMQGFTFPFLVSSPQLARAYCVLITPKNQFRKIRTLSGLIPSSMTRNSIYIEGYLAEAKV